jgi:hypothetical protein
MDIESYNYKFRLVVHSMHFNIKSSLNYLNSTFQGKFSNMRYVLVKSLLYYIYSVEEYKQSIFTELIPGM